MLFDAVLALAGLMAGSIASVAGFGIGSVLTPLLALRTDTRIAVAAVSIPHVLGTALRFSLLRGRVDRRIFLRFGIPSAAGGLLGALLHSAASSRALSVVFGCLLLFVAASEITGFMRRVRLGRGAAWAAGALSGAFGGLVGNQGGIRSAALLAFDLEKSAFVATATAVGLIVDAARMPVYVATAGQELLAMWRVIAVASAAVLAGTLIGSRLLVKVPDRLFRLVVAALLFSLGAWMLLNG